MKCHISSPNVKVFSRTIHALARFGDELHLESLPDCIFLRTLNNTESAFAAVKFNKNFFSYFNYNYYSTGNEGLKCKISMKSALNTFKSPAHIDKQVENLEIRLDSESSKLIFQLKFKQGIMKTHFVSILDCKTMPVVSTSDQVPNRITSPHKILSEALSNFQSSDDQVTIEAAPQSLIIRNYIDNSIDLTRIIRSQIVLKPIEFDSYNIEMETAITFTLKELRALLTFAEALTLPLHIKFEETGKPVLFIIHNSSTFEAEFVMATMKSDNATEVSTQSTIAGRNKRKDSSGPDSAKKKLHIDNDMLKELEQDDHLFDFIDVPHVNNSQQVNGIEDKNCEYPDKSKAYIKSVFRRCFENCLQTSGDDVLVDATNNE